VEGSRTSAFLSHRELGREDLSWDELTLTIRAAAKNYDTNTKSFCVYALCGR
jgi:hypothetical protein